MPTAPENQMDIEAISELLKSCPIGATVTYDQMTEAIGRPIQSRRFIILSAREAVEKETGALFETERGVGVRRVKSEEIVGVGASIMRGMRRKAKRGVDRLSRVSANDISDRDKSRIIAFRSQLGAISAISNHNANVAVSNQIQNEGLSFLPSGKVLSLFAGGN